MPLIKIRSVKGEPVSVVIDGKDITDMVLADPAPVVQIAPAVEVGNSIVTLALVGDVEVEVDGEVSE